MSPVQQPERRIPLSLITLWIHTPFAIVPTFQSYPDWAFDNFDNMFPSNSSRCYYRRHRRDSFSFAVPTDGLAVPGRKSIPFRDMSGKSGHGIMSPSQVLFQPLRLPQPEPWYDSRLDTGNNMKSCPICDTGYPRNVISCPIHGIVLDESKDEVHCSRLKSLNERGSAGYEPCRAPCSGPPSLSDPP